jgi:uncharacterized UPF0160 family protein
MSNENSKKIKIVTHSGTFHTDEVFACAILSLVYEGNVEVVRSRDPEVWTTGDFVVDVGYIYDVATHRFDHHQEGGAGARVNGIPYSSLGLVWKEYGEKLTGDKISAERVDEKLVQPVDAADCGIDSFTLTELGVFPYILHSVVSSFRPTWKEERDGAMTFDEGFARVLEVAKQIILREIIIAKDQREGEQIVTEIYKNTEDKRLIIVDGHYPWDFILTQYTEPLFVVNPDRGTSGKWKVKRVLKNIGSFEARKDLPLAWAGKSGDELAEITGVPDALFCHNKRFIAVAGSMEGALALAKLALNSDK